MSICNAGKSLCSLVLAKMLMTEIRYMEYGKVKRCQKKYKNNFIAYLNVALLYCENRGQPAPAESAFLLLILFLYLYLLPLENKTRESWSLSVLLQYFFSWFEHLFTKHTYCLTPTHTDFRSVTRTNPFELYICSHCTVSSGFTLTVLKFHLHYLDFVRGQTGL